VLKGELKGKRKETRRLALSAGEARNYEPLHTQLMVTLRNLVRGLILTLTLTLILTLTLTLTLALP
jgi:hypothetical protein